MFCHLVLNHPHKDKEIVGVCHRPDKPAGEPLPVGYILLDLEALQDLGFEWDGSPTFLFDLTFDLHHTNVDPEHGPLYWDYKISSLKARILFNQSHVVIEDAVLVPDEPGD